MDGERFDRMAKALVVPCPRRGVVHGLMGAVVALIPGMAAARRTRAQRASCASGVTCRGRCCASGTVCAKGKNGGCICPTTGEPSCIGVETPDGVCCPEGTTCYPEVQVGGACCTDRRVCTSTVDAGNGTTRQLTHCCQAGHACTNCGLNELGYDTIVCCPEGETCCDTPDSAGLSGCCPTERLCGGGCCPGKCCGPDCGQCKQSPNCMCIGTDQPCP
jgi:hypothetical protein